MPYADIHRVIEIARAAGAEIMALRDAVVGKAENKSDGSPVTLADKRSSALVIEGLSALTPHIPVISEENADSDNRAILAASDIYWIVDPLDGTRSYIDGHDGFGVHIGLIDKGVPSFAVIYFPAQGVLYYTDGATGAYRQADGQAAQKITVSDAVAPGDKLRAVVSWVARRQPSREDIDYRAIPAVGGGRVCTVAERGGDIALMEGPFSYWDIAAAHALLRGAGGELYELDSGKPVTYPSDRLYIPPSIGGHKNLVAAHRPAFKAAVANLAKRAAAPKPPQP